MALPRSNLASSDLRAAANPSMSPPIPAVSGFCELRILEIQVVNHLADMYKGLVFGEEALAEDFKRAEIALMGELSFKHVKTELAGSWPVSPAGHKPELCVRIDETADQPRTCYAIHVHTFPGHPCSPRQDPRGRVSPFRPRQLESSCELLSAEPPVVP